MRLSAGLTQKQLAERLGWRQCDISKVETCVRQLGHVELRHWMAALGIDMFALEFNFEDRLRGLAS